MNELVPVRHANFPAALIERAEGELLKLPQGTGDVVHSFSPGLYVRQVTLPAGHIVIGHHQKTVHLNVMLKGRVLMIDADGKRELSAPQTFVAPPGRKVGYILEEVVWLNIYPTTETDVEKLEETYLEKSDTFRAAVPTVQRLEDTQDFEEMLKEVGVPAQLVRSQSEMTADLKPFPPGSLKVKVGRSSIEGKGLIATARIENGELIAPARLDGHRTPAGRYTNHGKNPNAKAWANDAGDMYFYATRLIEGCRGGFDGEEITVDYRQVLQVNMATRERQS